MKTVKSLFRIPLLVGLAVTSVAAADVDISGFCDMQYRQGTTGRPASPGFQYGQFEFNATAPVNHWISLEGALALNPTEEKFEPGAGYADLNFLAIGAHERTRPNFPFLKKFGMWIGQFDVPFGIDYKVSSSIDRALVSAPLMNERTINSWNSIGAALHAAGNGWNMMVFGVNGFADAVASGGRIGIRLDRDVEVGVSYCKEEQNRQNPTPELFGIDVRWHSAYFSGKGEIVRSRGILNGAYHTDDSQPHLGIYFQGIYDVWLFPRHPFYLVGRIGSWTPENQLVIGGGDIGLQENRLTVGVGVPLGFQSELRVEYMTNDKHTDLLTFQLAVGF